MKNYLEGQERRQLIIFFYFGRLFIVVKTQSQDKYVCNADAIIEHGMHAIYTKNKKRKIAFK